MGCKRRKRKQRPKHRNGHKKGRAQKALWSGDWARQFFRNLSGGAI